MRGMESPAALQTLPPVTPAHRQVPGGSRAETASALARAERLVETHRYAEAVETIGDVVVPSVSAPDLALPVLLCEAWARMYLGQLDPSPTSPERARPVAQ